MLICVDWVGEGVLDVLRWRKATNDTIDLELSSNRLRVYRQDASKYTKLTELSQTLPLWTDVAGAASALLVDRDCKLGSRLLLDGLSAAASGADAAALEMSPRARLQRRTVIKTEARSHPCHL